MLSCGMVKKLSALFLVGMGAAEAFSPSAPPLLRPSALRSPALKATPSAAQRPSQRLSLLQMSAATNLEYIKPVTVDATDEASATVIWLHGLGDNGRGWERLSNSVAVPWVKWIFPTAASQPSTLTGGASINSWYDIPAIGVQEFREDKEGMGVSVDYIHSLIKEEIASGTPSERIILGGFSQGGCVAMAAALQFPEELGGVISVSSWYPRGVADEPTEANSKLPVLLCHGDVDPIAKVEWSRKSFEYVQSLGLPAQGNIYPGVGHEFAPAKVPDIKTFVQKNCPPLIKTKIQKPLGAVLEEAEYPKGSVYFASIKEGSNAEKNEDLVVGDQLLRVNGQKVGKAGFDKVMEALAAADGDIELDLVRPISDRSADWASLSEEEQERRYTSSSGVLKVCSDGPCSKQGAKNVIRWLTELTPASFSVTRCSCTGNCGNGPNIVLGGKGRTEKVMYGVNSVGSAVKMLREEFEIETDPEVVQAILNPQKNAEFGLSDELVRQGILASVSIRGSFESNRF